MISSGNISLLSDILRFRPRLPLRLDTRLALKILRRLLRPGNMGLTMHTTCHPRELRPAVCLRSKHTRRLSRVCETVFHRPRGPRHLCLRTNLRNHRGQAEERVGRGEESEKAFGRVPHPWPVVQIPTSQLLWRGDAVDWHCDCGGGFASTTARAGRAGTEWWSGGPDAGEWDVCCQPGVCGFFAAESEWCAVERGEV